MFHDGSCSVTISFYRDKDTQDGFMRYFGNQPHNFHLVGTPSHNSHVNISIPETNGGSSPSEVEFLSEQLPVLVNDENEMVRTEKRIMWTPQEDERLMSAWIENSTDSTTGADRKGEAYWGDVIKAYNKETPPQRKRNAKQAKDRWHKINRWCDLFESEYLKARRVFTSGYSDEMWMDTAEKFYLDHKLGPFVIKNVWKICREVPKWKTYNEELKNARKRKSYHLEEDVENVDSEDEMPKRPMGQKAAKKSALAAKGKSKAMGDDGKSEESANHVEKLDKLSKIQEEVNANRMKVLEMQQKLSSDKIETTRLTHLTAQENRESKKLEMEGRRLEMESKKLEMEGKKLEKESKMMDAYNNLISQDTSSMTDDEKSERLAVMKCLRKMLFPEII